MRSQKINKESHRLLKEVAKRTGIPLPHCKAIIYSFQDLIMDELFSVGHTTLFDLGKLRIEQRFRRSFDKTQPPICMVQAYFKPHNALRGAMKNLSRQGQREHLASLENKEGETPDNTAI